uniref:SH2 domain-containing protein n=1 Tax=Romanomermis culicivorax TaxID=13658 RepID=A0A915KSK8_ROMCU
NERKEASPTYTQPFKTSSKTAIPKVTRSPSVHPVVKPPPPPKQICDIITSLSSNKAYNSHDQTNDLMVTSSSMNDLNSSNSLSSSSEDLSIKPCYDDDLLDKMPWFHGELSRLEAEQRLKKLRINGAFLMRHKSSVSPNVPFCLSVLAEKRVYHLEIRLKANGFFALGKPKDDELVRTGLIFYEIFHRR